MTDNNCSCRVCQLDELVIKIYVYSIIFYIDGLKKSEKRRLVLLTNYYQRRLSLTDYINGCSFHQS